MKSFKSYPINNNIEANLFDELSSLGSFFKTNKNFFRYAQKYPLYAIDVEVTNSDLRAYYYITFNIDYEISKEHKSIFLNEKNIFEELNNVIEDEI